MQEQRNENVTSVTRIDVYTHTRLSIDLEQVRLISRASLSASSLCLAQDVMNELLNTPLHVITRNESPRRQSYGSDTGHLPCSIRDQSDERTHGGSNLPALGDYGN